MGGGLIRPGPPSLSALHEPAVPCEVTGPGWAAGRTHSPGLCRAGSPEGGVTRRRGGTTNRGATSTGPAKEPGRPGCELGPLQARAWPWAGDFRPVPQISHPPSGPVLLNRRGHSESSSRPLTRPLIHLFTPEFLWHTLSATPHGPWALTSRCEAVPLPRSSPQACRAACWAG